MTFAVHTLAAVVGEDTMSTGRSTAPIIPLMISVPLRLIYLWPAAYIDGGTTIACDNEPPK